MDINHSASSSKPKITQSETTDFGFRRINRRDKSSLVGEVFANVAKKYDLMNDLMSFGIHRLWKNKMLAKVDFTNRMRVIDVASGTGDIAFKIAKKASEMGLSFGVEVVDINQKMLDVGKAKAVDLNLFSSLHFTCCDGENLSFADESFDLYTIAFGIRNFTNIDKALSEAFRTLKKGGKFICLEFSKVEDLFLQKIYDQYSFKIIPKLGELVLNDRSSYQYLVESIRKFPPQNDFKKLIENAGFINVAYENLNFGVAAIHYGNKP